MSSARRRGCRGRHGCIVNHKRRPDKFDPLPHTRLPPRPTPAQISLFTPRRGAITFHPNPIRKLLQCFDSSPMYMDPVVKNPEVYWSTRDIDTTQMLLRGGAVTCISNEGGYDEIKLLDSTGACLWSVLVLGGGDVYFAYLPPRTILVAQQAWRIHPTILFDNDYLWGAQHYRMTKITATNVTNVGFLDIWSGGLQQARVSSKVLKAGFGAATICKELPVAHFSLLMRMKMHLQRMRRFRDCFVYLPPETTLYLYAAW